MNNEDKLEVIEEMIEDVDYLTENANENEKNYYIRGAIDAMMKTLSSEKKVVRTNNRLWWECYAKGFTFYFGFFNFKRGDIRLGGTLGFKESSIDLLICTFGFMR
jgi:hypothetical protein